MSSQIICKDEKKPFYSTPSRKTFEWFFLKILFFGLEIRLNRKRYPLEHIILFRHIDYLLDWICSIWTIFHLNCIIYIWTLNNIRATKAECSYKSFPCSKKNWCLKVIIFKCFMCYSNNYITFDCFVKSFKWLALIVYSNDYFVFDHVIYFFNPLIKNKLHINNV